MEQRWFKLGKLKKKCYETFLVKWPGGLGQFPPFYSQANWRAFFAISSIRSFVQVEIFHIINEILISNKINK